MGQERYARVRRNETPSGGVGTAHKVQCDDRPLQERHLSEAGRWEGYPIPWYSYPAIHFLSSLNWEDCRVLEFGSGYSTLWWAARAGHVTTIEGDPEWFRVLQSKGGQFPNVRAIFRDDHLAHARAPLLLDESFDVVVVDGGDRYLCAESAAQVVASDGLIVLDDSEGFWGREGTYPIIELLHGLGFGRVDHYGFRPCGWHLGCTSLFFRAGTKVFQHLPPPRREREVFGFRNRVSV